MDKILGYIILCLSTLVLCTSCQDIEDTYKDFLGNGEIRYLGKCNNLSVSPGWERLIVKWENSEDPIVDKIKLTWSTDDMKDSVLLDKGTTEYNIPNLSDNTYKITICSLNKEGESSLENSLYARPYTINHEEVISFSRLISKHYFIGNRLILQFAGWQDGIEKAYVKYTLSTGKEDSILLSKSLVSRNIYMIRKELDTTKPVTLYRTGKLEGCNDLIQFPVLELAHKKTYTSDFKEFLKTKYGVDNEILDAEGEIKDSWANNVKTLEIDTDLGSFEDILNFPKLTKLVLGKHRYLTDAGIKDAERGQLKVYDSELSDDVLYIMNELTNLTVDRYNKHYSDLYPDDYIKEMGKPEMPKYNYLDLSKAKFSIEPQEESGYNSHLEYLFDGNVNSCWSPLATTKQTEYTITIDLGKITTVKGLKFVQKAFTEYDQDNDIAPQMIKVLVAGSDGAYTDATYQEENYIGTSTGETILLPFSSTKNIRYVHVILSSQPFHQFYQTTFAELGLYN